MVKVKALDTYSRLQILDKEYDCIIKEGTEFQVSEERLQVLLGDNKYGVAFVEQIEEVIQNEVQEEKPKKQRAKKK